MIYLWQHFQEVFLTKKNIIWWTHQFMIDVEINVGGRRLLLMGLEEGKNRSHMGVGIAVETFFHRKTKWCWLNCLKMKRYIELKWKQIQPGLLLSMNSNNVWMLAKLVLLGHIGNFDRVCWKIYWENDIRSFLICWVKWSLELNPCFDEIYSICVSGRCWKLCQISSGKPSPSVFIDSSLFAQGH